MLDAAFGSLQLGSYLSSKGFLWTMGVNTYSQEKWIWDNLKAFLIKGEGRVIINREGVLASIFLDNKAHAVFSNSWIKRENTGQEEELLAELESDEEIDKDEDEKNDSDNDKRGSSSDGEQVQDKHEGAEWVVTRIEARKQQKGIWKYKTIWSTDEVTWETFGSFIDLGVVSQEFLQFANENDWKCGFQSWSMQKIKDFCSKMGISRSMYTSLFFSFFFNFHSWE